MDTTEIAEIWQEVLGVPVADDDDFFALGGQSLAAMEVVAAVRRRLGITVRVRVLLEHPVLADFAERLARSGEASPVRSREVPPVRSGEDPRPT
ncbi:phosphopantetheine-binding protein [Streptomyces sp. NPDC101490]|uniref:phosphopantetheine-binding protein n=1 Tax=Streptomyces sp. NPDC101490 TaxID=3366143 RepID=UPI00382B2FDC